MRQEFIVTIGGAAGEGIASTGDTFSKVCSRAGLHIFAYNSYQSVIRGGHVYMQIRVSDEKVMTHGDQCHYLIALNQDTADRHLNDIRSKGGLLFNADKVQFTGALPNGIQSYPLPVMELAKNPLMQNTVALGALMHLLGIPFDRLGSIIKETFAKKGDAIVTANVSAAQAGYDHAAKHFKPASIAPKLPIGTKRRLVISGNETIALASLAAGCKFYSAYPMTPASSIMHWLAAHAAKYGLLFKQAEDEIAAVNMAIGAGHAGVRAMAGTSGGGFALMTEAIGMAAMTETPVVVVTSQRGGPSTGLPTKTEQGDLFQMLGASQGDFPRVIMAPCNVDETFTMVAQAFNLAEKYQIPVIVASDLYLSEHEETVDGFNLKVPIDRGELLNGRHNGEYKRFALTPSGVSPRAIPGMEGTVYVAASDEHDEEGVVISDVFTDPAKRHAMMEKRMRKLQYILKELPKPSLEGPADAELTLVGWGSTQGVIREAMQALNQEGRKINALFIRYLAPFQAAEVEAILKRCKRTLAIEANYTGQLARLIRMETGIKIQQHLHKFDGEPFAPGQVIAAIRNVLANKTTQEVVAIHD